MCFLTLLILQQVVEEEENLALRGDKKQENPSSKPSAQGQVFKLGASPAKITSSAHFRKERSDQKRFTPKSVHMSINFASLAAETTKKASPALQTNRNSKINAVTTKMTKESLIPKRPMTRVIARLVATKSVYCTANLTCVSYAKITGIHEWDIKAYFGNSPSIGK